MFSALVLSKSSLITIQTPLLDPTMIGAIGLVMAAAAVVGVTVYRWLGTHRDALAFAMIAAFGFTATLAYSGVAAAGAIIWVMLIGLVLAWIVIAMAGG